MKKFLGKTERNGQTFYSWEGGYSIQIREKIWINFPHNEEPFSRCLSIHHAYSSLRGQAITNGTKLDPCPELDRMMAQKRSNYLTAQHRYAQSVGVDAFQKY